MNHSPGPWKIGKLLGSAGVNDSLAVWPENINDDERGMPICSVSPLLLVDDTDEANAKLIAAAPELLDALANLIRHHDQDNPYCESFNKSWYSARLAIYKAEGKK